MTTSAANGYRNDQFFGLTSAGEDGVFPRVGDGQYGVLGANNPPFIYPDRTVITQDANGNAVRTKLQRGYIRTLINTVQGTNVNIRKCAFQFNPQVLRTSVQMTQNINNAFQQDIGQYAVPVAGNTNFLFELFFDRSMELNNDPRSGDILSGDPNSSNIFSGEGALSPAAIGVLRDIGELNAIIGAGLSAEEIALATQSAINQIKAQATANNTPLTDASVVAALAHVPTIISPVNYGNSAFLIPQPVRVLFSSLFMVEGYVTNIDIVYTKFTTQMVPMQATVTVSMNALYVGFAKKVTYVTDSLDKQNQDFIAAQQTIQTNLNSFTDALRASAGSVRLGVGVYDPSHGIITSPLSDQYGVIEPSDNFTTNLFVFFGMPAALNSSQTGLVANEPVSAIVSADNSTTYSFSVIGFITVYGPYSSNPISSRSSSISFDDPTHAVFLADISESVAKWSDIAVTFTSAQPPNFNVRTDVSNYFTSKNVGAANLTGTQFWVIKSTASVSANYGQGTLTGSGSVITSTQDISTAFAMDFSIPLQWTTPTVPGANSSTTGSTTIVTNPPAVPRNNGATTVPAPGTTSHVGTTVLS